MLDSKDIKKLGDYLLEVFKDVFVTKNEFRILNEKIDSLQVSVDSVSKDNKKFGDSSLVQNYRTERLEKWAEPAGKKIGIKFNL